MEHITHTQLNHLDIWITNAEKNKARDVVIDTRLARDLLRELRRLRDRDAATNGTEAK